MLLTRLDKTKAQHSSGDQIVCIICSVCARLLGLLGLLILSAPFHLRHYSAIMRQQYTIITISTPETCHFLDLSSRTPSPSKCCVSVSVWLVMSLNLKSKNEIHPWLGGCWCRPELGDSALQIATSSHVTPPCGIQTPDLWFDVT